MDAIHEIIGPDSQEILWWQMICRGTFIFFYTLLLIRIGGRRIFGKYSSFDIVLGIILGSIMSRALTGNASFFPTMATAGALVALHWILAELARRSNTFGSVVKGTEILIVKEGQLQREAMRKINLTEKDVMEAIRSNGGTPDLHRVKMAYQERNGDVSVCLAEH